jgi:organic hydroperoxide reductase OsmC/OhrA
MADDQQPIYTTTGVSTREPSSVQVDDRNDLSFAVSSPEQSPEDGQATPEQLYAAALASCLHQAVVLEATEADVDTAGSQVMVEVTLTHAGQERFGLTARASIDLPGVDEQTRARVTERAVQICPMAGVIELTLS